MQAGFLTAERGSEDEVIVVIHKVPVCWDHYLDTAARHGARL